LRSPSGSDGARGPDRSGSPPAPGPPSDARRLEARLPGTRYAPPFDVLHALERVLDEPDVARIAVVYRPWYVASHLAFIGARFGSVTRPGRIYTNLPESLFFKMDAHVLHEYFHVVQQWGRERMTAFSYLLRCRQREREAAEFAAAHLARYQALRKAAAAASGAAVET